MDFVFLHVCSALRRFLFASAISWLYQGTWGLDLITFDFSGAWRSIILLRVQL